MALSALEQAKILTEKSVSEDTTALSNITKDILGLAPQTDPRVQQALKLSTSCSRLLSTAKLHIQMGTDPQQVIDAMTEVGEQYNDIVNLKCDILTSRLNDVRGGSLEEQLRKSLPNDGRSSSIANDAFEPLVELCHELDRDRKNVFFTGKESARGKNIISADYNRIRQGMDLIENLKKNPFGQAPGMKSVLDRVSETLSFIGSVDPVQNEYFKIYRRGEEMKGTFDTRALRIVGAIGGALVTGISTIMAIKNKSLPSWPTYLWAGLMAVSANPAILASHSTKGQEFLKDLQAPSVKDLVAFGAFSGPQGREAYEELVRRSEKGHFDGIEKMGSMNRAQATKMAGDGSELAKVLNALKTDEKRAFAAQTILRMHKKYNNPKLMGEIIEALPKATF